MEHLATFARVYVTDIEQGIKLFDPDSTKSPRLRFSHSSGLELALIGDVLVLAAAPHILDGFRSTNVTVIVDDLDAAIVLARNLGGQILREPASQPTGRNVTFHYDNGAVIEYVEWTSIIRAQVGL